MSVVSSEDMSIDLLADNDYDNHNCGNHLLSTESEDTIVLCRRITKGTIVKIATTDIFTEWTAKRNKMPFIYGVADKIEDQSDETGDRAWLVNWSIRHLRINIQHFRHICPQNEHDIIGVKFPEEEGPDGEYDLSLFFEKHDDGKWHIKPYKATCEFCSGSECDRMRFKDDLQDSIDDMVEGYNTPNNKKRKQLYKEYTYAKWGPLGIGVRKEPSDCVMKLARAFFPPPLGDKPMGYMTK